MNEVEKNLWKRKFMRFLKMLTVQQHKPLVLKSPTHGYRIKSLIGLFPDARFVLIERDPYDIFASNLIMWNALMTEFSHEEFNEDSIEQFIIDSFSLHEKLISEAQENIPSKQFTRIKYADLVTNPLHEIEGIYTNLELGFISTKLKENIEQYLRKVENYQCNILEITTRQRVLIETQWTDILSRYR